MMKFLVADDSRLAWRLFRNALKPLGDHQLDFVSDGKQAVQRYLEEKDYNALIVDWNMPVMQGIEAVRAIRKSDKQIPIIMISGIAEKQHIQEAYDAGVNAFLEKPITSEQLQEAFASMIP